MHKLAIAAAVVAASLVLGAAASPPGQSATRGAAGTLTLRGSLQVVSNLLDCPVPDTTAGICAARTGTGFVPGLGRVSEGYAFLGDIDIPACGVGRGRTFAYPVSFVVGGKGEIHFALAEGAGCVSNEAVRVQSQAFTVTGGTGMYAGASGSGTVERKLGANTGNGRIGTETWVGTLVAPGVDVFDITAPTLNGAVNKTVPAPRGAKTMRVRFTVTAQDAVDGARPVLCKPRSASRFKVGKTTVTCTAVDSSGNVGAKRFTVTVRAMQ